MLEDLKALIGEIEDIVDDGTELSIQLHGDDAIGREEHSIFKIEERKGYLENGMWVVGNDFCALILNRKQEYAHVHIWEM